MAYEQTQQPSEPKAAPIPVTTSEGAATAPAGGYDAQRASLKPSAPAPAPTGDAPKFDLWKLSPEVQAKFLELGKAKDPKVVESIVNDLVKTQGVPKEVVQGVVESNKGFFATTYDAIKGGSWHTVSTDATGKATLDFKADGKGIGWDAEGWSLKGDFKDKSATYTNKKDDWSARAGYDDRGKVTVTSGLDPKGDQTIYEANGGKDGGGAKYVAKRGTKTTTVEGDVTVKDGDGKATAGYTSAVKDGATTSVTGGAKWGKSVGGDAAYTKTEGDKSTEIKGGVSSQDGQTTGTGSYTTKNGDKSTAIAGTVDVGAKKGASGTYTTTDGDKSKAISGSVTNQDGQTSAAAGYKTTDGKKSTSYDGTVEVGKKTGGTARYVTGDDKKSTDVKGSVMNEDGTTTIGGAVTRVNDGNTTTVGTEVYAGKKTGAKVDASVDRKGYKVDGSVDATQTKGDASTTTEAGGSLTYTKKAPTKEGEDKPTGDDVIVNVTARGKKVKEDAGNESTNLKVGGGVKSGSASADIAYETEGGNKEGTSYRFHDITTSFGNTWDLDKKSKEGFKLNLGGHLRLSNQTGEETVATGDLRGSWYKGEGDDKKELTFRLQGGQDKIGAFSDLAHTNSDMLRGDTGYGKFGSAGLDYKAGSFNLGADLTLGQTDKTTLGGAHIGASEKDKWKIDAYAAFAKQDGGTASLFRLNSEFALRKDLKLGVGGSYTFMPGTEDYKRLWDIHTSLGYDLKKDQHLTLTLGVAGNGEKVYFVPEAMYKIDGKLSASVLGVIGSGERSVGAKVTHEGSGISVFGGYGNASALMNPYSGNAGMNMPGMDRSDVMGRSGPAGGAFIGVQWNALPTLQKLFK